MKVLFITDEFPPYIRGGAGIYAYYITKQLARYCDLTVATTNRRFGFIKSTEVDIDINVIRLCIPNIPFLKFTISGFNVWRFFKNKLDDFDLIHSNSDLLFMIKHQIPKIGTVHNTARDFIENEKVGSFRDKMKISFYYWRDFLEKKSFSNTDHFIVPSLYEKNFLSRYYQILQNKISVIPNGVEFDTFKPRDKLWARHRLGIPEKKKILLFVGRLEAIKRADLLVETMKFLDNEIMLIICGKGSKYPELLEMKREMGLNNVLFAGQINHNTVPLYYNAADLYVHSSIMENFPMVLLESMASGTPVMVSNTTGMKEITQNGKIGYILPETPREIADLIKNALDDDKKLKEEGENSLKYVKENYSWEKIAHSTFDVYKKMLKSKV